MHELDASELPEDWADALAKRGFERDQIRSLVAQIYEESLGNVFPKRSDVFRALHLTRLKDVRVVVLGQDPYPSPDQAHGLAFSVPASEPIPHSLRAIYSNLEKDPKIQLRRPITGDLTPWATNGVLLLNTALTVAEGDPGSHPHHWAHFTDLVLRAINEERTNVAFLLWGAHAMRKAASIPVDERAHLAVCSAHPAARGRTKVRRFRDAYPFSEAVKFLLGRKLDPVAWDLPTSP